MTHMRTARRAFAAATALICAASLTQGQARSISDIRATKSIIVGVTGNIPPFQFRATPTTPVAGFEVDIFKAIAADMGVDLVFKEIPTFTDLTKALAADQVDAIISTVAITSTRDKAFDLTVPYACLGASITTTDPNLKTQNDLKGKKVGLVKGTVFESYVQKLPFAKQINIISYETRDEQAKDFLGKKLDATVGWKAMNPILSKIFSVDLQDTPVLWNIPVGIVVAPNNVGLRNALNNSIYKIQKDGRLATLDSHYFPKDSVICKK